ncbi:dUTPase [Cronobacter phage LPCS28]|uniref:dUTP diphosphatase n=1 Tax=Cronobacter phage LPCS28 TaxID=2924885 RepID=A0AAE9GAR2_9CAUD|nr:dUTPase [Cronobacter phage LPCS28]UNY47025.1 deoxyuridine 5'-triphosphate nucleotidohydrolase [Cronobacter phage LPCS28]
MPLPTYATASSAGLDLRACMDEEIHLAPGMTTMIKSGLKMDMRGEKKLLMGMIVPRSGLGVKHGIVLSNLTGIIDADYQGEIGISVWNRSNMTYVIKPQERICQMIFVEVVQPKFIEVKEFDDKSERGEGGFGHTGTN